MKFLTSVAASLLLLMNAHAATVVIDFEDVAVGTAGPVSSRSFNFSGFPTEVVNSPFAYANTGNALEVDSFTGSNGVTWSQLSFAQQGLVPFDLNSFTMQVNWTSLVFGIIVTGEYASGGSIQTPLQHRDTYNPASLSFGTGWTNLKSVTIDIQYDTYSAPGPMFVDNITVSTVPIPAAVWLFASALGVLGWLQRRRNLSH